MNLNRLLNADGATVGYFTDDAAGRAAMQAARTEWDAQRSWLHRNAPNNKCRSIATPIKPLELEDVEPGDGDRTLHLLTLGRFDDADDHFLANIDALLWYQHGAASVEVQRHEVNRYRRPDKSNCSVDLGGPEQAAGVLYVLTIKAPK